MKYWRNIITESRVLTEVTEVPGSGCCGTPARRLVPFADRLHGVSRRHIQLVGGARQMVGPLVVGGLDVVEELILGRAPVDVVVLLGAPVEDAAVPRLADLPLQFELEVAELVF